MLAGILTTVKELGFRRVVDTTTRVGTVGAAPRAEWAITGIVGTELPCGDESAGDSPADAGIETD